jgi:rhomboid protease GluP
MSEQTAPLRRVSLPLPLSRPRATWVLLGLIVAAFLAETVAGGSTQPDVLIRLGAKFSPLIADGEYWRLFTSMFLHAGLLHLAFNGYALVAIGADLERLLGWRRFLTIYLLAGLLGSLASYALSDRLAVGASGAIFGLIGALAAFFLRHRDRLGAWGRSRLANIAFLIGINLLFGFTQPGIDNYAHLGGLVSGFALGWALAPRYEVDPSGFQVVDRNRLSLYWPALALAAAVLVGGTWLATRWVRSSLQTQLYRAEQAVDRGDWDEARSLLEQAKAAHPGVENSELHFYLGLVYGHLGLNAQAASEYEAALDLAPGESSARWNLALTYLALERYPDARAQFEAYLELNPGSSGEVQPYLDQLRGLSP